MSCRGLQILFCLCLVIASAHLSSGRRVSYKNYRLYQVTLGSKKDILNLMKLQKECDSLIFLEEKYTLNGKMPILVAPHKRVDFESEMANSGIHYRLLTEDYKYYLDNDEKQIHAEGNNYDWNHYYELSDTYAYLKQVEQNNPTVQRFKVGLSAEGRDIFGVFVSESNSDRKRRSIDKPQNDVKNELLWLGSTLTLQYIANTLMPALDGKGTQTITKKGKVKPSIFVEAGMHGNDWITSAVATYIINELVTSQEPIIRAVAKHYNWFIVPHANPDGYVYSGTTDPLWSRTRGQYEHCIGADPNRNWDYNWQPDNATIPKCINNYRGPRPFSEVETRALSEAIKKLKNSIQMYISLHFRERNSPKFNVDVSNIVSDFDTYPHGGSSVDWAYAKAGIVNSLNFQLRKSRASLQYQVPGTQVPASEISKIAKNAIYSLAALAIKALPFDGPIPSIPALT